MSYASHSRLPRIVKDTTIQAAIACQTTADKAYIRVTGAITVLMLKALVTTAQTVTTAIVSFDQRITPGSDTGRVTAALGTLTIPLAATAPIGTLVYKNVRVDLNPGDEIVLALTQASTVGGAIFDIEYVVRDSVPGDSSDMLASA